MAQVRAGVRLRKALCAVLEHPSVSHRFEGLGLTILEVRMAKDFKKAHVRWTVADVDEDDEYASHAPSNAGVSSSSSSSLQDTRRRFASSALRRNATRLRSMASKMLRSKHTPRLVFVDDDARSVKERELDAAFDRAADEAARNDAYAAEVKAREAEVLASARRRDGTSDLLGPYDDDALDETDETDETDGTRTSVSRSCRVVVETPIANVSWPSATPSSVRRDGGPPAFVVTLSAGETLYLPAMWYHHVEQGRCPNETENDADDDSQQYTIAVNFWHDMRFDDRFATARFLETARERAVRLGGTSETYLKS
jgi:ribosome-binding factor A